MILANLTIVESDEQVNLRVNETKIEEILTNQTALLPDETVIRFTDAIVFPGLINSHDHLDFNLFPRLGQQFYSNYQEWGKSIHQKYAIEIANILKIPTPLREDWGQYKNLLSGVTTVVNHGEKLESKLRLINVVEDNQSLHSLAFERNWKFKLNNPLHTKKNVVIHIAEGINGAAKKEGHQLIKWNLWRRNLIGIHAVALKLKYAKYFKAIVWCPQSNQFLLNTIADVNLLKSKTKILFGTDSTLTGNFSIWDDIKLAMNTNMLTKYELYQSLTATAAEIWKLNTGKLEKGFDADLVVAKKKDKNGINAFFKLQTDDLLLVMCKGKVLLFDESLKAKFLLNFDNYTKIEVNGSAKYLIGNLEKLMNEMRNYQPNVSFPNELMQPEENLAL